MGPTFSITLSVKEVIELFRHHDLPEIELDLDQLESKNNTLKAARAGLKREFGEIRERAREFHLIVDWFSRSSRAIHEVDKFLANSGPKMEELANAGMFSKRNYRTKLYAREVLAWLNEVQSLIDSSKFDLSLISAQNLEYPPWKDDNNATNGEIEESPAFFEPPQLEIKPDESAVSEPPHSEIKTDESALSETPHSAIIKAISNLTKCWCLDITPDEPAVSETPHPEIILDESAVSEPPHSDITPDEPAVSETPHSEIKPDESVSEPPHSDITPDEPAVSETPHSGEQINKGGDIDIIDKFQSEVQETKSEVELLHKATAQAPETSE